MLGIRERLGRLGHGYGPGIPRVRPGTRVRGPGIPGLRGPTGVGKLVSVGTKARRRRRGVVWRGWSGRKP